MTRAKVYLVIQALLCILLVTLLSVAAVRIFREGSARKAQNPGEIIYVPEEVSAKFAPIAPLFFAALGFAGAGLVLGIKDEDAEKPVKNVKKEKENGAGVPVRAPEKKWVLQAVIVVVAAALIVAGVINQSARDVLYKAVRICSECIGLG